MLLYTHAYRLNLDSTAYEHTDIHLWGEQTHNKFPNKIWQAPLESIVARKRGSTHFKNSRQNVIMLCWYDSVNIWSASNYVSVLLCVRICWAFSLHILVSFVFFASFLFAPFFSPSLSVLMAFGSLPLCSQYIFAAAIMLALVLSSQWNPCRV